jgi:hypothetical protein
MSHDERRFFDERAKRSKKKSRLSFDTFYASRRWSADFATDPLFLRSQGHQELVHWGRSRARLRVTCALYAAHVGGEVPSFEVHARAVRVHSNPVFRSSGRIWADFRALPPPCRLGYPDDEGTSAQSPCVSPCDPQGNHAPLLCESQDGFHKHGDSTLLHSSIRDNTKYRLCRANNAICRANNGTYLEHILFQNVLRKTPF